jgi:glycosyltransferase involved in cell wall biosynthesis
MISIVTGTLNRKHFLPLLINNTVLSSDKVELILVDGGSEDGTIEYINNLNHDRIKLIKIGQRSSYPHYMNIGIRESKYEWVAQWNDDVILFDNWEMVLKELEENYDLYIFKWTVRKPDSIYNTINDEKWIRFDHCMNF